MRQELELISFKIPVCQKVLLEFCRSFNNCRPILWYPALRISGTLRYKVLFFERQYLKRQRDLGYNDRLTI